MNPEVKTKINVAPSSDNGHFVEGAKSVVNLDKINETFVVEGPSELTTAHHTTLEMNEDCIITCQVVFNPFSEFFEKSRD